jgi:hypothetical protein
MRFVAGTTNGQPGYVVFRLDGRVKDGCLTKVYDKIRTRKEAEKIARRLRRRGLTSTNTRYHIPDLPAGTRISLEEKQKQLRQKEEFRSDPDLTAEDVAVKHNMSTDVVLKMFKDEPGVHNFGPRLLRIPRAVYNRVINRMTVK